ncbi:MAG TPA: hypothetical protein VNY36_08260, partial [Bacteroidia bacterium]|nr:hypothetical protein [Bacteroidia bacterium]
MFGDFNFADQVAIYCASIDVHCRNELRNGTITSERDYVSVLSARIRDGLRISGHICHAQTLRQGIEVENGVDGIVLFQFNDEVKVGWYEAKWPRVRQNNYGWDSLHVVRGQSHFSEQIIKQHKWEGIVALWEMFFNEAERGFESPPYEYFGSSCVWHNNTFEFMRVHGKIFESWTTSDLKLLLDGNCIGFYSIIYDILSCRKGKKMLIEKD